MAQFRADQFRFNPGSGAQGLSQGIMQAGAAIGQGMQRQQDAKQERERIIKFLELYGPPAEMEDKEQKQQVMNEYQSASLPELEAMKDNIFMQQTAPQRQAENMQAQQAVQTMKQQQAANVAFADWQTERDKTEVDEEAALNFMDFAAEVGIQPQVAQSVVAPYVDMTQRKREQEQAKQGPRVIEDPSGQAIFIQDGDKTLGWFPKGKYANAQDAKDAIPQWAKEEIEKTGNSVIWNGNKLIPNPNGPSDEERVWERAKQAFNSGDKSKAAMLINTVMDSPMLISSEDVGEYFNDNSNQGSDSGGQSEFDPEKSRTNIRSAWQ